MPKLFRWFGRLRPTQPTADVSDDLPWQDRVDQVRAMMDALAPAPPRSPTSTTVTQAEIPAEQPGDAPPGSEKPPVVESTSGLFQAIRLAWYSTFGYNIW